MGSNVQFPPSIHYLWLWAPASEIPAVQSAFPPLQSTGWFKGSEMWHLLSSREAQDACDEVQILRIHLLLQDAGTSLLSVSPIPQSPLVLRAITIQMQAALDDKNLGTWAELMQTRTRYLPWSTPPPPPWRWHAD